jgi:hypothetical protein
VGVRESCFEDVGLGAQGCEMQLNNIVLSPGTSKLGMKSSKNSNSEQGQRASNVVDEKLSLRTTV